MRNPTLSVIMSNYNHAKYIGEALEAILSQSFRPIEVIVIDDASTDNSVEIIEQFVKRDPIVHLIRNEKNMGVVYNANKLLELAKGDYVYFAAADDKILPGFFEKSMNLLMQYPQAGLCCSDPVYFDGLTDDSTEHRLYLSDVPRYFSSTKVVETMRQRLFHIAGHTSIIKRSAMIEAGRLIPELKWHCDWFALLVIAFRYGICYIPKPLAALRVSSNSYSASGTRQWTTQREVLSHMLYLLKSPEYRDVLPLFKKSGVLSTFHSQILYVIIKNPDYWGFLNLLLFRRSLWYSALKMLSPITPSPVKRVYRSIRDIRARKI
jgi:glycosyltransferase involved in cell wall biosynthesis